MLSCLSSPLLPDRLVLSSVTHLLDLTSVCIKQFVLTVENQNRVLCLLHLCLRLPVHVPIPVILLNRSIFFLYLACLPPSLHQQRLGLTTCRSRTDSNAQQTLLFKNSHWSTLILCSVTTFHKPFTILYYCVTEIQQETQTQPGSLRHSSLRTTILKLQLQHEVPFTKEMPFFYPQDPCITNH